MYKRQTTALDVTIQAQVLEMMKGLKEKYEMSMLMITHDLGIVAEICDEVSVVYAGRVVEHGTLADVFDNTRHPYTCLLYTSLLITLALVWAGGRSLRAEKRA